MTCLLSLLLSSRAWTGSAFQSDTFLWFPPPPRTPLFSGWQLIIHWWYSLPTSWYKFCFLSTPWNWKWLCGADWRMWHKKPRRWNEKIMEAIGVTILAFGVCKHREHLWPTFNPNVSTLGNQAAAMGECSGEECLNSSPKYIKKQKSWKVDRHSGVSWPRQRATALVDACHPPLGLLWLAFVVPGNGKQLHANGLVSPGPAPIVLCLGLTGTLSPQHKRGCSLYSNKSAPSAVTVGPLQDCLSLQIVLFPILLVADISGRMSAPQSQAFTTAVGGMPP